MVSAFAKEAFRLFCCPARPGGSYTRGGGRWERPRVRVELGEAAIVLWTAVLSCPDLRNAGVFPLELLMM